MHTIGSLLLGLGLAACVAASAADFRMGSKTYASQADFIRSGRKCGTPPPSAYQQDLIERRLTTFRARNKTFVETRGVITVPVQFHVIHDGNTANIDEAALDKQLEVLNEKFQQHSIQFMKAGVKRTDSKKWSAMTPNTATEREAKTALSIDASRNLNFYVARIGDGLLGWATFPTDLAGDPTMDGVVVLDTSLPGGTSKPYDLGMTAVHEVGHWLGLYHTFQGECAAPGDEVDDTPFEGSAAFGCPPETRDTCPSLSGSDPVTNFMDYVDDRCMLMFTDKQEARMHELVGAFRPGLLDAATRPTIAPLDAE